MKFKAITIDLDQTLIDFIKMKRHASSEAAKAMVAKGLPVDVEVLKQELFNFYMDHGIESNDAFQAYLQSKFGKIDYRILAPAVNAYLRAKEVHMKPYPDVVPTLEELKSQGMILGVISDAPRLNAHMRLDALDIDRFFDFILTLEDTGKLKDTGEPFEVVVEMLKLKPNEILHVGDRPDRDVVGAKAAGLHAAWAEYGSEMPLGDAKPDFTLKKFSDILEIVK